MNNSGTQVWNDVGRTGNINGAEAEIREMFRNDAVTGDKDAFTDIFRNVGKKGLVLAYLSAVHTDCVVP